MTHEQIEAIRERAEKATKGPWERFNVSDVFTELGATNNEGITAEYNDGWNISSSADGLTFVNGELTSMSTDEQIANAEFIAHSREDIPALLAEVERLRNGILTAASSTHDDDTHEYLFRLLNGKERSNLPYRIGYDKDGGGA